jgi:hypothetical protein
MERNLIVSDKKFQERTKRMPVAETCVRRFQFLSWLWWSLERKLTDLRLSWLGGTRGQSSHSGAELLLYPVSKLCCRIPSFHSGECEVMWHRELNVTEAASSTLLRNVYRTTLYHIPEDKCSYRDEVCFLEGWSPILKWYPNELGVDTWRY